MAEVEKETVRPFATWYVRFVEPGTFEPPPTDEFPFVVTVYSEKVTMPGLADERIRTGYFVSLRQDIVVTAPPLIATVASRPVG